MKFPPLVEPAQSLTADEVTRYSRHLLLPEIGLEGQKRLKAARVLVVGAGGLGSPALLYLAAAGVGTIGIVEFDTVDESNLQRQILYGMSDVGRPKAECAAARIKELNPHITVRFHSERLEAANARAIFSDYDLIVDGADNFATRYLVNDACILAGKPYVWGSIFRFEGQASVFWERAPGDAGLNYRDLYPEPPPPSMAPSCAEGGVLGVLCASIGAIMATEALKLITGAGDTLLGRLVVYDALDMSYRFIPLRRDPQRQEVTELIDYRAFCMLAPATATSEVPTITAKELKELYDCGADFHLIDVRELSERNIVHIAGADHIPNGEALPEAVKARFDKQAPIILHCKSGARSKNAQLELQKHGFANVKNLEGGILAWIADVDPTLPRY